MKVKIMSFKPKIIARLAFALALSLTACGPDLTINSVTIYTDQDANQNSAIAVDLVVLHDQNLANSLGKMSASQYFSSTTQLLLDNPTLLDIWHWELVPGQVVQVFSPETSNKAYAGYVFANYLTPGDHRLKVAPSGIIAILLQKNDLLNLSTENLVAPNPGTTMSDVLKAIPEAGVFQKIPHADVLKKVPQLNLSNLTSQSGGATSPILKKPIPIATHLLKAPPALQKNIPGAPSSSSATSKSGGTKPPIMKQLTPKATQSTKSTRVEKKHSWT